MDARIDDLEIRIAFMEDLIDEMNRTLFRQQQRIDLLTGEVVALREQLRNAPSETATPRDEIPPHY
jgi:SlyX protein